jgi:hypothetical protein
MSVKRYSITIQGLSSNWPVLAQTEDDEGKWVMYSDYDSLREQLRVAQEWIRHTTPPAESTEGKT